MATFHVNARQVQLQHQAKSVDTARIEQAVRMILEAIGEAPDREGLVDTPARVARMYQEIFSGLHQDPRDELTARFHVEHGEVVLVRDIPFHSMCEHHLLPFFGIAHIAYLPHNHVVTGLSKLARLVDVVAKKPQVQERMTNEIADALVEALEAEGVLVVVDAEHLCMSMRGIRKPGSRTTTVATRGRYLHHPHEREEVLRLIRLGG
ncbi:GTP cyclohydrolase I FolE [Alicyclobacillus acidocaldarius]|uniref:GTP cyclohydrolase 1 n=1 Tax=Alicyclobacillus acidocaldarius subsp. acidocaldarius (strain ATCC 27009 / DSM 446 / BCRC 14685 / JCM 5260 / KCTC 1825 / NBRC 15652 / NCIMB 11725 / NRRL B-14509 / 104-IA) TaxID=521098 RepID=C8WUK5_ALIAD|nr:GTP cyclohydrolase I FolE [Alicyclobacillus acidocaldarius]ACV59821.1 GTP cyclohydrolase I [Alicyclobacillus acidocaldarius subsp. acidocaldarius DSM 446]